MRYSSRMNPSNWLFEIFSRRSQSASDRGWYLNAMSRLLAALADNPLRCDVSTDDHIGRSGEEPALHLQSLVKAFANREFKSRGVERARRQPDRPVERHHRGDARFDRD